MPSASRRRRARAVLGLLRAGLSGEQISLLADLRERWGGG
jgi:hypothetical protein